MRILCGFYAKGQEFVRIRLEETFPNALKNSEDLYAQIREVNTRQMQKINFISLLKFHNP
jgi:ABC-type phosphate transport system auxiliary subunit